MTATAEAYRQFRERGGVADLSARTKLRVTGADRVRYLNGQVTQNVTRLRPLTALPACVCTAKGKLSAEVVISVESEVVVASGAGGLVVDAEPELREALHARLERYIIADDVVIEDVTDAFGLLHFMPPPGAGAEALRGTFWDPVEPVACRRFGRPGFDFLLNREITVGGLAEWFAPHHVMLDEALLEVLRVEAGIPRWGRELSEDTLPPEAGLDRTHVDYHKGCYIGQETISRLRSVGHVNRELTGLVSVNDAPLAPGMRVFAPGADAAAKPVAVLTSAAWSFGLCKPVALGYLKRSAPADGLLARPADADEPALPVVLHPLPFLA